jgi:hypothetical protein
MPRAQRTNNMAIGQSAASAIASWPAPLGNRRGATPARPTAAVSCSISAGSQLTAAAS